MYCSVCGRQIRQDAHFCDYCGTSLEMPESVTPVAYTKPAPLRRIKDPFKQQIKQLRLQIKQLKLNLKRVNTNMSNTRARYHETSAFVPRGFFRRGYKIVEDLQLLGPQQQKQQLQDQIIQLEQELLGLEQAQVQWKQEQDLYQS